jgi:hypothetical protein
MKPVEVFAAAMLALAAGSVPPASAQENAEPSPPSEWEVVPPPPAQPPAPSAQAAPSAPGTAPSGQWVYTEQYGWIWMPYGDAYSYVPPGGAGEPYEYVYYPSYGWTWVVAPWIWGFGAWPYFGVYGAVHFGWYGSGYWRTPWLWHYRPAPAPVHLPGTVAYGGGLRAAPGRGFFPRPAPAAHGSVGHAHVGGGAHGHGGHH